MSKLGEIAIAGKTLPHLNKRERVVLSHIADCHTPRMGENSKICECGHTEIHYNSCRDRHCPLCQGASRIRWVNDRLNELLPVSYFHVVFTIPHELLQMARANHKIFYQALFSCTQNTLLDVCKNPENLGARIGGMSVLHTWTQKLDYHPHLHCIVPSGGIAADDKSWIKGNSKYLVPVKRLSSVFRGKLLSHLEKKCNKGELFGDHYDYVKALRLASRKSFVVYAKKPFGSPSQVIKYLGRYTHRVGISEQRILYFKDGEVCFSWLDRAAGNKRKRKILPLNEFVNRFLLHLLPKGMRKIRYFGYMSNRNRQKSIDRVRLLISENPDISFHNNMPELDSGRDDLKIINKVCSQCGREFISTVPLEKDDNIPESGWLKKRLEHRQFIHGPEPNSQKVS